MRRSNQGLECCLFQKVVSILYLILNFYETLSIMSGIFELKWWGVRGKVNFFMLLNSFKIVTEGSWGK